jgi:integrase
MSEGCAGDIDLETGALRIRQARVDVNGRDTTVAPKTERSARDLPLPPRELALLKAMRAVHIQERFKLRLSLADAHLLLSRADGTPLPVRDYSREFTAQRKAAGLGAITLGKLRHSNISRMRAAGIGADVVAAWHGHTERMTPGRLRARHRRPAHRRVVSVLGSSTTKLGHSALCPPI